MSLDTAVRNGKQAQILLEENNLLAEALDNLESEAIENLVECDHPPELLERKLLVSAIRQLRHRLKTYVINGSVAQMVIDGESKET